MAPHGSGATNWWRRPWGVCTSSTHAELGTRRTALSPWCSRPPLTRRTTTAVVHRRYSRRCTNPLSQVVVRALLQGGWSLVPFLVFFRFFLFCSMNTNGHREKNTSGGRRSFGWVVDLPLGTVSAAAQLVDTAENGLTANGARNSQYCSQVRQFFVSQKGSDFFCFRAVMMMMNYSCEPPPC